MPVDKYLKGIFAYRAPERKKGNRIIETDKTKQQPLFVHMKKF